ncbi:SRPBCC family protein [Streptomyces sp. NPDC059697]|uniref:SRPBCC family protein n=1 Tax=Streptomyces sp. NPDC059697 TaxID=3346912 RepID=UPI00367FE8DB
MELHRYRFRSVWDFARPPDEVFAALRVVDDWPLWWPGVRRARRIDEQSGAFLLRSLLPFDLHLTITGAFEDTESRVLRGVVGGDLEGVSGWSVRPHGTGSRAVLEQDMVARKALIRRLEVPFRPLFRANHYLLTYRGHRGLKAWLDGGQEARRARQEDRRPGTRSE